MIAQMIGEVERVPINHRHLTTVPQMICKLCMCMLLHIAAISISVYHYRNMDTVCHDSKYERAPLIAWQYFTS